MYCFEHKSCSAFFDWGQTRSLHIASIVFTSFTKHLETKTLYFTNTHALILPAIRCEGGYRLYEAQLHI